MDGVLVKMVFQMKIYGVWKECSGRRHQKLWSTAVQITCFIDNTMHNKITSLKYGPNHKYKEFMQKRFEVAP
ncbi:hypothetical protein Bca4012_054714 [Brassica carinata]